MENVQKKGGKFFYGWWIVVGCCFLQGCCLGLMMNSAGIFYTPVCEELGIGLGPLALYLTVYFFVTTFNLGLSLCLHLYYNYRLQNIFYYSQLN